MASNLAFIDLPNSWDSIFDTPATDGVHADSIPDGLILCLCNLGRVDIGYISRISGEDKDKVISVLRGSIYLNPMKWNGDIYQGWETSEEYLSGNLIRKFREAETANETYRGVFDDNVKALMHVLPPIVRANDIYITLGSPWVPADIIDDFILHLFVKTFSVQKMRKHVFGWFRHNGRLEKSPGEGANFRSFFVEIIEIYLYKHHAREHRECNLLSYIRQAGGILGSSKT
ncbi:MAG: hypothetical protein IJ757_06085 [Clostridiales bacterium]|nr:hypothetical protein [Clostridiales bacterium]